MTTMTQIHTDSDRRHDFVLLFDVQDGNPNGDPDAGNLPRMDHETAQGLVTDVCLKRKVRDYVDASNQDQGKYKIYIQRESYLTETRARVFRERTRLYSPEFLEKVFGTDLELDEFDGICVVAANDSSPEVDRAELPLLLKWTSNSPAAQQSKMQTIKNLWIEAVDQIPTGEAGLIYLAYKEGHRPSLADARTEGIRDFVENMYFKRRAISIPMTVISRLYPNVVLEGRPDFIESTIPLARGGWDNFKYWTQEMPTRVFTF